MEIPHFLITQVREAKGVLVLGAGASASATAGTGRTAPLSGQALAGLIADQFLGGEYSDQPLPTVSEYAISEASLFAVQEFIKDAFEPLEPAPFHLSVPSFKWHGIATTNFDRVIEKAYEQCQKPLQRLKPVIQNGDGFEDCLRDRGCVLLLKLHGCISRTAVQECPLILTPEQYITHRAGRSHLFQLLEQWANERPLIFVGHSIQDPDLRALLLTLSEVGANRLRYYAVVPDATPVSRRFWEGKRTSIIDGTFEEFLSVLDSRIPAAFRPLAGTVTSDSNLAVAERFSQRDIVPSAHCTRFLSESVDYVKAAASTTAVQPVDFYRGDGAGWAPIEQSLDVKRALSENVLLDVFLNTPADDPNDPEVVLIKGHAGAGKSVLLRRIAWQASHDFNALCLFIRADAHIDKGAVLELLELVDERVYLFVDDAARHVRELVSLIRQTHSERRRITYVLGERLNEWNVYGGPLASFITNEFVVEYLESNEIDQLLSLLEKHKALGTLEKLSKADRRTAFEEKAGRQLLVALHEATLGKPFEEIIEDEFNSIVPVTAQDLYLTICLLNRLGVRVRAGLISRVHDVPFHYFEEHFFLPLEHVVKTSYDRGLRDHVYTARHPYIAEMVFRRVLKQPAERLDKYVRTLEHMNLEYSTDGQAFRQLLKGRVLEQLFPDKNMVRQLYNVARALAGDDPLLLHQMALYEMHAVGGDLAEADRLLSIASRRAPRDLTLKHSQAELQLSFAESARSDLEKEQHLRESARIARDLRTTQADADTPHAHHTLIKIALKKLEWRLHEGGGGDADEGPVPDIVPAIREAEETLAEGLQRFPDESYLLDAEARLATMLNNSSRALSAMKRAFETNPLSGYIAVRLARAFEGSGDPESAQDVLTKAIGANPTDTGIHYRLARLLMQRTPSDESTIRYHLQRSFIEGDYNHEAKLVYGRHLFLNGQLQEAEAVYTGLRSVRLPFDRRTKPLFITDERFAGNVQRVEMSYCFIQRDGAGDRIFAHRKNVKKELFRLLMVSSRVTFKLGFSFSGPVAVDLQMAGTADPSQDRRGPEADHPRLPVRL